MTKIFKKFQKNKYSILFMSGTRTTVRAANETEVNMFAQQHFPNEMVIKVKQLC